MSQYIRVATPNEEHYKTNNAIVKVLSFLGEKQKEKHHGAHIQRRKDYRVGRDFVARKCGKGYKNTIDNMAFSRIEKTIYNADYRNWKFHKIKAKKFLIQLYLLLRAENANTNIWKLFDQIYNDISKLFNIEKQGSDVISYPYLSELYHAKNDNQYSNSDRKSLASIVAVLPAYNKLYYKEQQKRNCVS